MIPRRPVVLVVAALALAAVPGCDMLSSTYTPPEKDFSVRVMGTPVFSLKPVPGLPFPVSQRSYEVKGNGVSRGVAVMTGIGVLPGVQGDAATFFERTVQGMTMVGGARLSSRRVSRDGIDGTEFLLTLTDPRNPGPTKMLCQMYLVGADLYIVGYEALPKVYSDGAARSFVDSFRLLKAPGGSAPEPAPVVANNDPPPDAPATLPRVPSLGGGKSAWRNESGPSFAANDPNTFASSEPGTFGGIGPTPPPAPDPSPPGFGAGGMPPRPAAPRFAPPPGFGNGRDVGEDTPFVGGNGGGSRRMVEAGRAMVGIDYALGSWANEACFSEIRPVFDRDQPVPPGGRRALAPKGYAVGGAEVQSQQYVDAARLIFFRLKPDGTLDPSDRKEGNWVGFARRNRPSTMLGGDGRRVVGVHCHVGIILDGFALVMEDAAP